MNHPQSSMPAVPDLDALLRSFQAPLRGFVAKRVASPSEGLTQIEAASRAGLSLSGMKSRVQRGREQLRERVLACCEVDLDRRRSIARFESRGAGCGCGSR